MQLSPTLTSRQEQPHILRVKTTCPKSRVLLSSFAASITRIYCACELLLKIMAVLAKVSMLRERLPSILVDPCLYHCCTTHQAFVLCAQRAVQEPFDRRAWVYAMLYVNLHGPQLLYSTRKFRQVFLTHTVTPSSSNRCLFLCWST